jgi:hypothetical protein
MTKCGGLASFLRKDTAAYHSRLFVFVAAVANRNRALRVPPRKGRFLHPHALDILRSAFGHVGTLHQLSGKRFLCQYAHLKDGFQAPQRRRGENSVGELEAFD